jgi:hypothetical protein
MGLGSAANTVRLPNLTDTFWYRFFGKDVTKGTGTALMALGRVGTGKETFRAIGSLEGKSVLEVSKTLRDFGFKFKSRTEGGFIQFVGPGSRTKRLEVQIRPNGQVIRLENFWERSYTSL